MWHQAKTARRPANSRHHALLNTPGALARFGQKPDGLLAHLPQLYAEVVENLYGHPLPFTG